jgi:hypothetical protein
MTRLGRLRYIANGVGRPLPESIGTGSEIFGMSEGPASVLFSAKRPE